ncbi:MAG: D-alanyl-D-alanine carboxypeptidase [Caldilineae bacterium]|nr:MAG: D-alanyl-D-alanine carboxypeptidase [Caldilineae bacterium]
MTTASNNRSPRTRRWLVFLLISLALWTVAAGPPHLRSGHPAPIRLSPSQIRTLAEIARGPQVEAAAAALSDRPSATVLWAKNADASLPMASTTKLMTALLALESLDPDQIVTVPPEAIVGNASMGLQAGEQVSVRALLYGLLLPSGNDAAMTLAIAAAGSEAAFVEEMNRRAAAWGLTQTHFANPHGLDAPGQVSSARDLLALARRALDHPLLAQIVATPSITIEGYTLTNTNRLLTSYPGTYGVKTGTTDAAGQVLIAAARRPTGDALGVVLNSPDRYRDMPRMLDYYFDHWRWVDTGLRPAAINKVMAPDGTLYRITTPSRPLLLQTWQILQLRAERRIAFDVDGHPSGVYQVWLGEEKLLETPLTFEPLPSP